MRQERETKSNSAKKAAAEQAAKTDIGWGHQIRSYVLQPYQMVKDLRTGVSTSNTGAVLDGDLDRFMEAALAKRRSAPRRRRWRMWSDVARGKPVQLSRRVVSSNSSSTLKRRGIRRCCAA